MQESRNPPPTRQTYRSSSEDIDKNHPDGPHDAQQDDDDSLEERTGRRGADESLDEIIEESEQAYGPDKFTDASDAVVMVVQDHATRAQQRKQDFVQRTSDVKKRLDDLAATQLRRELSKTGFR